MLPEAVLLVFMYRSPERGSLFSHHSFERKEYRERVQYYERRRLNDYGVQLWSSLADLCYFSFHALVLPWLRRVANSAWKGAVEAWPLVSFISDVSYPAVPGWAFAPGKDKWQRPQQ